MWHERTGTGERLLESGGVQQSDQDGETAGGDKILNDGLVGRSVVLVGVGARIRGGWCLAFCPCTSNSEQKAHKEVKINFPTQVRDHMYG